jgi:hypothetical protein
VSRLTVTESREPYQLTIQMPPPRSPRAAWLLPLSCVYLAAVVLIDVPLARGLLSVARGPDLIGAGFSLVFLLATFGAANAALLWALAWSAYRVWGAETVTLDGFSLRTRRAVFGIGLRRSYACADVSEARLAPMSGGAFDAHALDRRGVLFDARGKTRSFGDGLTPAEALEALEALDRALADRTQGRPRTEA